MKNSVGMLTKKLVKHITDSLIDANLKVLMSLNRACFIRLE